MKKIFFKNDVEFNKYIEKADNLDHRKTFNKKNEIIKIFDDIINFGLINYKNLISEYINSSKFNYFERIRFQLYLTIFSKIKYKYFKKLLAPQYYWWFCYG